MAAGPDTPEPPPSRSQAAAPEVPYAASSSSKGAAGIRGADKDGGARTLARRRTAFVRVHGAGRPGACVASFLAASGVGHVACSDPEPAEPADLAPAGLIHSDLGQPRQRGAARAVERAAPDVRTGDDGALPDLVILTGPVLPDLVDGLMRDRVPHLAVWAAEAIGVVGPLVAPARSTCLRCVDLRKAQADPQWPKILAQATFTRARPQACDTVLAAMTATLAAAQALALIDRAGPAPVTVNGTLEVVLPDWQWRRRTWQPHPACGCGARVTGTGFPGSARESAREDDAVTLR
jgi:hypothetical protein